MTLPTWRSRAIVYQTGARLLFYVVFYVQILAEVSALVKLINLVKLPFNVVPSL